MAEEGEQNGATGAAAAEPPAQAFKIQRVYVKDVSYESPQAPNVFVAGTPWKPSVSLHLNTESTKLDNDLFEVVLGVTATVKLEETTVYLIEIKQAGLFLLRGFDEKALGPMLGSYCPNVLFPFAREEIGSLVQKGGFPQLLLEPVNFDALYAKHVDAARRRSVPAPDAAQ